MRFLLNRTSSPRRRRICFRWNEDSSACKGECGMAHVCTTCAGEHACHANQACKDKALAPDRSKGKSKGKGKGPGRWQ